LGAGVVGSFNPARLKQAGQNVTLLPRGRRPAELREHGVVLEDFPTRRRTATQVPLVDQLGLEDACDVAIVAMRRNQIASILPVLAQNHRIPNVLFLGEDAARPQEMIGALGKLRVLVGGANVSGTRQGYEVRYLRWRWMPHLFGGSDGVLGTLFRHHIAVYPHVRFFQGCSASGTNQFQGGGFQIHATVYAELGDVQAVREQSRGPKGLGFLAAYPSKGEEPDSGALLSLGQRGGFSAGG